MKCYLCGHESRVLRTVGHYRRRECKHCRHRWTTAEIPVEVEHQITTARKMAQALLGA